VKHEWGHFIQLLAMGPKAYALGVGIPSMINGTAGNYYSQFWEVTADIIGGASYTHTPGAEEKGWWYFAALTATSIIGPLGLLFLIGAYT
jgi:hypothetical protein